MGSKIYSYARVANRKDIKRIKDLTPTINFVKSYTN